MRLIYRHPFQTLKSLRIWKEWQYHPTPFPTIRLSANKTRATELPIVVVEISASPSNKGASSIVNGYYTSPNMFVNLNSGTFNLEVHHSRLLKVSST